MYLGKTAIAVFRPVDHDWRILRSSDQQVRVVHLGSITDKLVPADYDGDGQADIAVWRPSDQTWHILQSSDNKPAFPTPRLCCLLDFSIGSLIAHFAPNERNTSSTLRSSGGRNPILISGSINISHLTARGYSLQLGEMFIELWFLFRAGPWFQSVGCFTSTIFPRQGHITLGKTA